MDRNPLETLNQSELIFNNFIHNHIKTLKQSLISAKLFKLHTTFPAESLEILVLRVFKDLKAFPIHFQ